MCAAATRRPPRISSVLATLGFSELPPVTHPPRYFKEHVEPYIVAEHVNDVAAVARLFFGSSFSCPLSSDGDVPESLEGRKLLLTARKGMSPVNMRKFVLRATKVDSLLESVAAAAAGHALLPQKESLYTEKIGTFRLAVDPDAPPELVSGIVSFWSFLSDAGKQQLYQVLAGVRENLPSAQYCPFLAPLAAYLLLFMPAHEVILCISALLNRAKAPLGQRNEWGDFRLFMWYSSELYAVHLATLQRKLRVFLKGIEIADMATFCHSASRLGLSDLCGPPLYHRFVSSFLCEGCKVLRRLVVSAARVASTTNKKVSFEAVRNVLSSSDLAQSQRVWRSAFRLHMKSVRFHSKEASSAAGIADCLLPLPSSMFGQEWDLRTASDSIPERLLSTYISTEEPLLAALSQNFGAGADFDTSTDGFALSSLLNRIGDVQRSETTTGVLLQITTACGASGGLFDSGGCRGSAGIPRLLLAFGDQTQNKSEKNRSGLVVCRVRVSEGKVFRPALVGCKEMLSLLAGLTTLDSDLQFGSCRPPSSLGNTAFLFPPELSDLLLLPRDFEVTSVRLYSLRTTAAAEAG